MYTKIKLHHREEALKVLRTAWEEGFIYLVDYDGQRVDFSIKSPAVTALGVIEPEDLSHIYCIFIDRIPDVKNPNINDFIEANLDNERNEIPMVFETFYEDELAMIGRALMRD